LSGNVETGFAIGKEGQDAIRIDLADMNYNLNGYSENLLAELTALKQTSENSSTMTRMQGMEDQLNALANDLQVLQFGLGSQLAKTAQAAIEKGFQSLNGSPDEKIAQTVSYLKMLGEQARVLRDSVQSGIETTRTKAADLLQNPQSEEAKKAFEAGLLEFANLIQFTQSQIEEIQKQISSLAGKLTQTPEENTIDNKPIGMAETPAEGTQ